MLDRFETFTVLIHRINRNIRKLKNQEMAAYDLRSAHISCLYYLYIHGGLTATDLCERCEEDKATVSRALDYLEQQDELDAKHIIVHGHSRLGKTALWAGANDPRIWLTVSNCSGTGGAKIAHRYFGESFAWLNLWFPYWFCSNFAGYAGRESEFPIDQHVVMAAIAPRLLFIASASEDLHADPRGEYSGGVLASEAWNIFGRQGLENTNFPPCSKLIGGDVGYYLRPGNHDFMPENWDVLLEFVKRHLAQEKIQKC